jgi:hypothetical protein
MPRQPSRQSQGGAVSATASVAGIFMQAFNQTKGKL